MTVRKNGHMTKNVPHGTILIPELEEAARTYVPKHDYSEQEQATIRDYYGRVPTPTLARYLKRSVGGIQQEAARLGIKAKKQEAR
jgi:hypothetical protein